MDFLRQELKRKLRMSGLSCAHSILTQAFRTHIHVTGADGLRAASPTSQGK